MKRSLIFIAFLSLQHLAALAADQPLKERAADAVDTIKRGTKEAADATVKAARRGWKATKEYLSQDPREFRDAASRKLDELSGEIDALKGESGHGPVAGRGYFQTRLKALHEQLAYARAELTKLPPDKDQKGYEAARTDFNHTLDHLEAAVDQAKAEARDSA